jgi:hypothetical protein
MKNIIKLAALAALASVSAYAQLTVSYSNTTAGGIPLVAPAGGNDATINGTFLSLPKWDNTGDVFGATATLVSVQYRISTYQAYGRLSVTALAGNADVDASLVLASATMAGPFGGSPSASASLTTGPAPQVQQLNVAPGSLPLVLTTPVYSATGSYFTDPNTASYVGTGTVSFDLGQTTSTAFNANAAGTSDEISITATAGGRGAMTIEVLYTYQLNEVPEPSTYAAMGFAGLVAGATVWRRRQMAKKA